MAILQTLCNLTLKGVVGGACLAADCDAGVGAVDKVVGFLTHRFVDHSQSLTGALRRANEQAWKALEVALAGSSFWDKCKLAFNSAEERAFREQVRPFLESCNLAELNGKDQFRQDCLRELRAAAKGNLLSGGGLEPQTLARQAGAFARYDNPQAILEAETRALGQVADDLRTAGHANLAAFITLRPQGGDPLLVVASRYFFRRQVEDDSKLFQGLAFAQLESLQAGQEAAFSGLHQALIEQADRIELVLLDVQSGLAVVQETVTVTLETVTASHETVLDIRAEQERQSEQTRDLYRAVIDLQNRLDLAGHEVRPQDSLSIRNDAERHLVKQLVGKYRSLPDNQRRGLPALLNAIGKLEVAAGDFQSAQSDFASVAELVADPRAQAEAHFNAYRAALERRDWATALAEVQNAARLDAGRFSPFPLNKYIPQKILGAGGFGVAFLCRHKYMNADVVVKTLTSDDLDRGVDQLFGEAQVLRQLDHPAIIRIQDCGFASSADESHPYLVMDYFAGATLEDHAREQPLGVEDLLAVARQMAEGLRAAHGKNILHRDIKPANVLVRREGDRWHTRLIDFGLALKRSGRETMLATSATLTGSSIAGTLDYAAPEQMGKLAGVPVRPASDVFGFGKTCCYALFGTPQPLLRHWRSIPDTLAELLESCLEDQPAQRPQDFGTVLEKLAALGGPAAPAVAPTAAPARPVASVPLTLFETSPSASSKPVAQMTKEERLAALNVLAMQITSCTRCQQLVRNRTQTVFGEGPLDPDICFIGEAPGGEEDVQGRPFIGESGRVLMSILAAMGMKREDVYLANILKCRPPNNRTPWASEATNCREFLEQQLDLVRPKHIVALGGCASQNLLGTTQTIGRLRGRFHDWRGIPVLCTYHPAFLLPNRSPEKKKDVWEDMKILLRRMGRPVTG
jgi:uracil-DNA glycosylase family 4